MRRLLIALLVLAVLLVGADRGGDYLAERTAADNLESSQHLASRPDVDIHGFPFLTQFASGDYDHISLDADELPVAHTAGLLRLSHLHIDFNQVHVARDFSTFHANSATAQGLIDYADLSRRLGITVRYAGHNRVQASRKFSVLGRTFTPTVSVAPAYLNGALTFGRTQINGAGQLAGEVSSALNKLFGISQPLDGIPFDVSVRSLRVDAQGLEIELVGADLTFRK